jgi:hypothetical protein
MCYAVAYIESTIEMSARPGSVMVYQKINQVIRQDSMFALFRREADH